MRHREQGPLEIPVSCSNDTCIVLRVLLKEPKPLRSWGDWEEAASSDLMGVEVRRAIDRLRLDAALDDEQVAELHPQLRQVEIGLRRISINRRIIGRAAQPMATAVNTLDAVRLASALVFQEAHRAPVLFATHDVHQSTAARALGFVDLARDGGRSRPRVLARVACRASSTCAFYSFISTSVAPCGTAFELWTKLAPKAQTLG